MRLYPKIDAVRGLRQMYDPSSKEFPSEINYRKGDDGMRLCPLCVRVWQLFKGDNYYKGRKFSHYPEGFPTIGKPREVCPKCKDRNNLAL